MNIEDIRSKAPSSAKYYRQKYGKIFYYKTDMIGSRYILYRYENERWQETILKDWSELSKL
ncbi:hypothetical protein [Acinetobacter bereziniae]|uniref:hypothetical protein n=1 Tax=Acinetobacter bereziniae TaxID=106648 RepID=UPI0019011E27|nr:hypothetical protein [Acinetobacter bereziniae]MBJ9903154.1 hypothetical protein [Acinetobacter bereziniae]WMW72953.1 hypothetical protein RG306_11655 [Acinetobacter bereziniae]